MTRWKRSHTATSAGALGLALLAALLTLPLQAGIDVAAARSSPAMVNIPPARHQVKLTKDLIWATPAGVSLALDIYQPQIAPPAGGANLAVAYPVLTIFHGGGWLINNKSIMQQMAHYLASHANLVVVNVDYRLLSANYNTTRLNQTVEDAMGAVLWVQQHIAAYQGDPARVAVTGDSAGGHLAAMVMLAGQQLTSKGFASRQPGFQPSYLPPGATAESIAAAGGIKVQAAILSYAVFDLQARALAGFETAQNGFWAAGNASPRGFFGAGISVQSHPELYRALSPQYLIPSVQQRQLPPQLVHVGSRDTLATPALTARYVDAVKAAGHAVEFTVYSGLNHAYLDNDCNSYLGTCFARDAIEPLNEMIAFLQRVFAQPAASQNQ